QAGKTLRIAREPRSVGSDAVSREFDIRIRLARHLNDLARHAGVVADTSFHRCQPCGCQSGRHRSQRVIQAYHLPDSREIMRVEVLISAIRFERLAYSFLFTLLGAN